MSFGSLSEEAKIALSRGAELAGTGTGGHLPGSKNTGKISEVRGITAGEPAVSPPTFKDLSSVADFKRFADRVREITGAAPLIFRDHISVPTIPALARARHYLDKEKASGRVTLLITGGLRTPVDFVKALALGADGIGLSNSALQAIGCVAARMCNTNNCPAGIATWKHAMAQLSGVKFSGIGE